MKLSGTEMDMHRDAREKELFRFACDRVADVLIGYVAWLLQEAEKKGIKRLYFLSRDGYILKEIAHRFCKAAHLDIDCRYLYVSRISVSFPAICLRQEEVVDLDAITGEIFHQTPASFLKKCRLNEMDMQDVLQGTPYLSSLHQPLTSQDFLTFKQWAQGNDKLKELVRLRSEQALWLIQAYFVQEGLMEENIVGIVDSGWQGVLQKNIRLVLDSMNYKGALHGFYFGLFHAPPEMTNYYHAWYFMPKRHLMRKVLFNSPLFETLVYAPHPMTTGYRADERGMILPDFEKTDTPRIMLPAISVLNCGILRRADDRLMPEAISGFYDKRYVKKCMHSTLKIMALPDSRQLSALSLFSFCGDLLDGEQEPLVDDRITHLRHYTLFGRLWDHLRKKDKNADRLLWPFGTIGFCNGLKKAWYWMNYVICETAKRIILHK